MSLEPPPDAEVVIDDDLVRSLLRAQVPHLAEAPLRRVGEGWDNVTFQLGDDLAVRLPRRAAAVSLVANEQRCLPLLAPHLPLPVPVPRHCGEPGPGYPWPWSVVPWLPGRPAAEAPPTDLEAAAESLGRFGAALHRPAPADAPHNPFRSIPLAGRDALTRDRLGRAAVALRVAGIDPAAVDEVWTRATREPGPTDPPRWLHGDLHPANVVAHRGRITAVIDFGDVCAGDRSVDLAVAWMLFPTAEHRHLFREAAGGVDDATWQRARGWAVTLGLMHLTASAGAPAHEHIGLTALAAACT
jgi:aminoglycoside phosphotransferase (APT) family kinase protein